MPSWTVSTASGSSCSWKDSQICRPAVAPYFFSAASRASADCTSPPPPEPNSAPTTEPIATMSVFVNGSIVPAFVTESIFPVSTYSPGNVRFAFACVM